MSVDLVTETSGNGRQCANDQNTVMNITALEFRKREEFFPGKSYEGLLEDFELGN